jgi:hypothetical protein
MSLSNLKPKLKTATCSVEGIGTFQVRELTGRERLELAEKYKAENPDYWRIQCWGMCRVLQKVDDANVLFEGEVDSDVLLDLYGMDTLNQVWTTVCNISGIHSGNQDDSLKNS